MADNRKPESVEIDEAVKADWARNPWYEQRAALFNPSMPDMRQPDAIEHLILDGWRPAGPFIDPSSRVSFIGGCYGGVLAEHLKTLTFASSVSTPIETRFIPMNETLATTFALRQIFEWEFEGIKPDPTLLKGNRALEINYSDALWKGTLDILSATDVFVLLISSAELWCDEPTGAVLWRETPGANPVRQKFRTSTVAENRANLQIIHDLMRKHRPEARMICVLSPIPMIATHRQDSCIVANTVSKAVLRAAIDEFSREIADRDHFFYWPLYDVVLEGFGSTPYGGHFNGDRRHINEAILDYMMLQFEAFYCRIERPSASILQALVTAKIKTGELPSAISDAADRKDRRALQHLIDQYEWADDRPVANLIVRYAEERLDARGAPDAGDWQPIDLAWQALPSLEWVGPAPCAIAIPAVAWGYGAASAALHAEPDSDLLVQISLRAMDAVVGVMLIRPDGSALSNRDRCVRPTDDWTTVDLRVYPSDGPTHVLLRNFDSDGVSGQVQIQGVLQRRAAMATPGIGGI